MPVIRPAVAETTALGAAYAAGLAVGFWDNSEEVCANWSENRRWMPGRDDRARTEGYARWQKAVARSLGWIDAD